MTDSPSGQVRPYKSIDELREDGHLGHIASRILDQEENLRDERLIRRLLLLWLSLGNLAIIAIGACVAFFFAGQVLWVTVAAAVLLVSAASGLWYYYRNYRVIRAGELYLRKLQQVRKERLLEDFRSEGVEDLLAVHKRYREDAPELVEAYRLEASRYRRVHNIFQGVIIVGSIVTSTLATASVVQDGFRWFTVAMSVLVGIAAGFIGYFKYRERSFSLQQTADSIERQYFSVELRVGRYMGKPEAEAYADFANEVEWLREEQSKRQQQLEQPPEVKAD